MSDQSPKSIAPVLVLILVVALVAAAAFFYLSGKSAEQAAPPAEQAAVNQNDSEIVTGEVPPQPEIPDNSAVPVTAAPSSAEQPVVVDTKTLDVPQENTAAPETSAPAVASTPAVDAMMAPRSIGSPTAPIKVTEYSSLTCSHCAEFHKNKFADFKTKFVDTGRVQMTFKEFPLNPPALDASMILRCMPEDKFVSFMNLLFEDQDNWAYKAEYKDVLRQQAKLAGMSDEQFDSCLANDELKNRILADMKAASDKYKVQSTPSFVVNDGQETIMGSQPIEKFQEKFDALSPAAPAQQ